MKELEEFAGKRMPYREGDEYVSRLIADSAERAIAGAAVARQRRAAVILPRLIAVAAAMALAVLVFTALNKDSDYESYRKSPTLSEVLNSMSDESLMCVSSYEIEDIPEYEE